MPARKPKEDHVHEHQLSVPMTAEQKALVRRIARSMDRPAAWLARDLILRGIEQIEASAT
jgi:hypothetical protein